MHSARFFRPFSCLFARAVFLLFAALLASNFAACGGSGAQRPAGSALANGDSEGAPGGKPSIVVAFSQGDVSVPEEVLWISYGLGRLNVLQERADGAFNQGGSDFDVALSGYNLLLKIYRENAADWDERPGWLDALVHVEEAGFLPEYVLYFFAEPGWTVPAETLAGLRFEAFGAWATDNMPNHNRVVRAATYGTNGSLEATVPGATLIEATELSPNAVACSESIERYAAAAGTWAETAERLPGAPLAADDARTFARLLHSFGNQSPFRERGATWVPLNVARLHHWGGFCANDTQNESLAVSLLKVAQQMAPQETHIQLELAHALIHSGDLQAALAVADQITQSTDDACALGNAWRKKGFIYFEQGKLRRAYKAYVESLKHEPGHKLALGELKLIRSEARDKGDFKKAAGVYVPPPVGVTLSTQCGER